MTVKPSVLQFWETWRVLLQVAPKLTKTNPLVNFAKYLVDRQF